MSDIQTYLQQILDAVYGEEVRGSIHDAISEMNSDLEAAIRDDLNPLAFKGDLGVSSGTSNDLNSLTGTDQRGIWRLLGSHTYTNVPSDFDNGKAAYLIMYAFGTAGQTATNIKQEIHYFSSSGINENLYWSRNYLSGSWSEWESLSTDELFDGFPFRPVFLDNPEILYNGNNTPVSISHDATYSKLHFDDITATTGTRAKGGHIKSPYQISCLSDGATANAMVYVDANYENISINLTVRLSTGNNWGPDHTVLSGTVQVTGSGFYTITLTNSVGTSPSSSKYIYLFMELTNPSLFNSVTFYYDSISIAVADDTLTKAKAAAESKTVGNYLLSFDPYSPYLFGDHRFYYNGAGSSQVSMEEPGYKIYDFDKITSQSGALRVAGGYFYEGYLFDEVTVVGEYIPLTLYVKLKEENVDTGIKFRLHRGSDWGNNYAICELTVNKTGPYQINVRVNRLTYTEGIFNACSIEYFETAPNNIEYFLVYKGTITQKSDDLIQHCGVMRYYTGTNTVYTNYGVPGEEFSAKDFIYGLAGNPVAALYLLQPEYYIDAISGDGTYNISCYVEIDEPVYVRFILSSIYNWAPNQSVARTQYIRIVKSGYYNLAFSKVYYFDDHPQYIYLGYENGSGNKKPIKVSNLRFHLNEKENANNLKMTLLSWGDSLTAGAGGGGTTYPSVCASELGLNVINCGVGGETANTISARQGGNTVVLPAGSVNGNYTVNQLADIFGYHVNPLRQGHGSNSGNKLVIKDETCDLSITQTTSVSDDAIYTISGYTGGSSSIPVLARFIGSDFKGDIVTIWVGQNGSNVDGDTSVEARIAIINSMISHIGHKKYVVLGLSSGTESSRASDDARMLKEYGAKFFPTRKLLVNYGLTVAGVSPTTQDQSDISVGTVPTSLRYDSVHMNANGYTAIGKLLAEKIMALGYLD